MSNRERNNLASIEHLIAVAVTAHTANHTVIPRLTNLRTDARREKEQRRGIVGVIDGYSPKGIETEVDIEDRKNFLRTIGYKL